MLETTQASINIIYLFFSIENDDCIREHVAKNNYLFILFDLNKPWKYGRQLMHRMLFSFNNIFNSETVGKY